MGPPSESQDPLDTLQLMVNEVLVQTGKALRASRKTGQGNITHPKGTLQSKLPDTIRTFHSALDDLENDIIRAKSVLLRDLTQLQEQRQQKEPKPEPEPEPGPEPALAPASPGPIKQEVPPEPVEAQSREPMVIDLESSPVAANSRPAQDTKPKPDIPVAPMPDMGMGLTGDDDVDVVMKEEPVMPSAVNEPPIKSEPVAATAPMAPMPNMDDPITDTKEEVKTENPDISDVELNFTNMEFTLAPTNNDSQNPPSTTQNPSFDLTTFAPADGGNNLLSLDNLLPEDSNAQGNTAAPAAVPNPEEAPAVPENNTTDSLDDLLAADPTGLGDEARDEITDSNFDDWFMESGADFDTGDGLGDPTLEDLINDSTMQHGDYDTSFFGIDKTDEA